MRKTNNSKIEFTWVTRRKASSITTFNVRTIDRYIEKGYIYAEKIGNARIRIAKETLTSEFINALKPKFL